MTTPECQENVVQPRDREPTLHLITAAEVQRYISSDRAGCLHAVRQAYLAHADGRTVLPHSAFLTFPEQPANRIISLPAYLGDEQPVAGIKWIASFPGSSQKRV